MAEIGITTADFMDKLELASYRGGVPELLKVAADEWEKQRHHFLTVINLLQNTMARGSSGNMPPEIMPIDASANEVIEQLQSGDMIAVSSDTACIVSAQIWIQHGLPGEAFKIDIPNDIYPRPYAEAIKEIPGAVLTLIRRDPIIDDITTKLYAGAIEQSELLDIASRLALYYYFQKNRYKAEVVKEFNLIWQRLNQLRKYQFPKEGNRRRALKDFKRNMVTIFNNIDKRREL